MEEDTKTPSTSKKKRKTTRKETEKAKKAKVDERLRGNATVTPTPGKKRKAPPVASSEPTTTPLQKFLSSVSLERQVKIKNDTVLPWIRDCFQPQGDEPPSKASASNSKKRAINRFGSMSYETNVKVESGKSHRIAKRDHQKKLGAKGDAHARVDDGSESIGSLDTIPSTYSVESSLLRRCIIEDVISAPVGDLLVVCVSPSHPEWDFYKDLYERLGKSLPVYHHGGEKFIQLHGVVAKQSRSDELTKEPYQMNRNAFKHLLCGHGNGGIGIDFNCNSESRPLAASIAGNDSFSYEIQWKELFFSCETIHVWGPMPPRRRFVDALKSLSPESCSSLFNRLLVELDGDRAQVFDLCNAYQNTVKKTVQPTSSTTTAIVPNEQLGLEGDAEKKKIPVPRNPLGLEGKVFNSFAGDIDSYVKERILRTYGCFISFTDGILEENKLNKFVDVMFKKLPLQANDVMSMLGYNYNQKERTSYLDQAKRRMVFYCIVSLAFVDVMFKKLPLQANDVDCFRLFRQSYVCA